MVGFPSFLFAKWISRIFLNEYGLTKADKILAYMGLSIYRDRLAWGLPYGVLKRIEIARVLMCDPQLIILDEPAAGLNDTETRELADLIRKIRDDFDCTVLLFEHDMGLVMMLILTLNKVRLLRFLAQMAQAKPLRSVQYQALSSLRKVQ